MRAIGTVARNNCQVLERNYQSSLRKQHAGRQFRGDDLFCCRVGESWRSSTQLGEDSTARSNHPVQNLETPGERPRNFKYITSIRTGWGEKFDEFYAIDSMEIQVKNISVSKLILTLNFRVRIFALCSTRREGKTFVEHHRSQLNSFLEKRFLNHLILWMRANNDFMVL